MDRRPWQLIYTTSTSQARSNLKRFTSGITESRISQEVRLNIKDQIHAVPGLLSPHMATALVSMSRSQVNHRLANWMFDYGLKRRLRLPLHAAPEGPRCWCGKRQDVHGDHAFGCREISKLGMHNFARDMWAQALQPI